MALELVYSPLAVGPVTTPNRIVRTSHNTALWRNALGPGRDGIGDEFVAWHEARARGEVGLTILEVCAVHPAAGAGGFASFDDEMIGGYQRLMNRLSEYPMRIFAQFAFSGRHGTPVDGGPPWAPSYVPGGWVSRMPLGRPPVAMTKAMIDELVEAFSDASRRALEGGLHGVEFYASHGGLPAQFMSPLTNLRDDEYGGSLENRLRFTRECLAAMRTAIGPSLALGFRMSAEDTAPGGLTVDDNIEIARALVESCDVDYINVSLGDPTRLDLTVGAMDKAHGYELPKTLPVARAVDVPSIVVGRITTLQEAEDILATGDAQLVSMVRATIADPDIVRKTRLGGASEVRPCIGCNHGCYAAIRQGTTIGCTVNPVAGRELTLGSSEAAAGVKRIVVVGGGPAGLEAARVGAERGHSILLFEAGSELGGQIVYARRAPYREDIGLAIDWFGRELPRLGVELRLETTADASAVSAEKPDVVIIATGSSPRTDGFQAARPLQPVDGLQETPVATSWDVLGGDGVTGSSIVVLDDLGHYEAIAAVDRIFADDEGAAVHFVTRFPSLGTLVHDSMSDVPARARFGKRDFALYGFSELVTVAGGNALIRNIESGRECSVSVDTTVLVSGGLSNRTLAYELEDAGLDVRLAGDAFVPRFMLEAIHEGHRVARAI